MSEMNIVPASSLTGPSDVGLITSAAPVDYRGRIQAIDVIRGFALFGVVWMNLFENTTRMVPHAILAALSTAPVDRVVGFLSSWLMQGKAQCLFGILFGFGFAVFSERVARRQANARLLYARRLTALLVFGWAHLVFLWWGDILHDYALLGFLLLLTPRLPSWVMLALAVALLCLSGPLATLVASMAGHDLPAELGHAHAQLNHALWQSLSTGDYGATVQASLLRLRFLYDGAGAITLVAPLIGQFLFGAWLFRQGWLQDVAAHRRLFRRAVGIGLPIGITLASLAPLRRLLPATAILPVPLADIFDDIGTLVLALGYGAAIALLATRRSTATPVVGLAAFGRMALTNYVAQSFFYFFIEDGFGLDLFTRTGVTTDLAFGVAVSLCQIAFSMWWLGRFRFGPLEWLWRSVTYGKWQQLVRA